VVLCRTRREFRENPVFILTRRGSGGKLAKEKHRLTDLRTDHLATFLRRNKKFSDKAENRKLKAQSSKLKAPPST
jgi:hypothetical protein